MPAETNDMAAARTTAREDYLADLLHGIENDPVGHVRRVPFAMALLDLDRATRLRACRAAIRLLSRKGIYAEGFMPTLLAYLPDDEVLQLRNDLQNQKFFAEHVPDLAEEMVRADLPAGLR